MQQSKTKITPYSLLRPCRHVLPKVQEAIPEQAQ